ncbi:MAG TPA: hypothetical protein PKL46_06535 [Aquabacterium sp.]|nr:hypothetical protein [Aquabacterium sp.]
MHDPTPPPPGLTAPGLTILLAEDDDVVFVLTTSDDDDDRMRAYHAHIAGYMVKAAVGPQFSRLALLLGLYQNSVRLPSPP